MAHPEARDLAQAINTRNQHTITRVDAGVNLLLALVIGVAGGLLIVFELGGWPW
ncbi:MAG: hypothetical protein ACOVPA_02760 [Rubrivivax sp.]